MKQFIAFILIVFLFHSCGPCDRVDCLSDNYFGHFRIISAANGEDLVFGPTRFYDKKLIKFFALNGVDTTFFDFHTINSGGTIGFDSILQVSFFPETDIAFMRLSDGDVDTFQISYNTFGTKCCGTITEITNFRFNNTIDLPGGQGIQEIKK